MWLVLYNIPFLIVCMYVYVRRIYGNLIGDSGQTALRETGSAHVIGLE